MKKENKKLISPLIIGIAGSSGSGKTTTAERIKNYFGSKNCTVIPMDNYYFDLSNCTKLQKEKHNYDHPDAIDFASLVEDIIKLKNMNTIRIPVYDFKTHERCKYKKTITVKKIIIIEGILLFTNMYLNKLLDLKVFLDTPLDICLIRRIKRDLIERNRTFESVYKQYLESVRPMYFGFVKKSIKNSDLILKGDKNYESKVISTINNMIILK